VEETDEGVCVSINNKVQRARRVDAALTNQGLFLERLYDSTLDRSVPVVYQDNSLFINGVEFDHAKSENGLYAVAYRFGEVLLISGTDVVGWLSISVRAACVSNTGLTLLGGNLSDQSFESASSSNSGAQVENISTEADERSSGEKPDEIALYAPGRKELNRTTAGRVVLDCAITADGSYACVLTEERRMTQLSVYELPKLSQVLIHETEDRHPSSLSARKEAVDIRYECEEYRCYLSERPADDPSYAVDFSGEVVWENNKGVLRDDVEGLMTKIESPAESVTALENTYTSVGEALRSLQTIARRNPAALEEIIERLVDFLKTDAARLQESKDTSTSLTLLFSDIGQEPKLIDSYVKTLGELVTQLCTLSY
jgi:hypothetical protein